MDLIFENKKLQKVIDAFQEDIIDLAHENKSLKASNEFLLKALEKLKEEKKDGDNL